MFETVIHLIAEYGLFGLFLSSFLGSTIFIPFSVELVFPPLLASGVNPYGILLVSVLGSLLGVWVNYLLGYFGIHLIQKHVKHEDILKAKRLMDKYGWFGVLFVLGLPIPLPTDPITVLCGISEMNPIKFTLAVLVGKFVKYGLAVGFFSLFI